MKVHFERWGSHPVKSIHAFKMDVIWTSLRQVCVYSHTFAPTGAVRTQERIIYWQRRAVALRVSDMWQQQPGGATPGLTSLTLDWHQTNVQDNWTMWSCVLKMQTRSICASDETCVTARAHGRWDRAAGCCLSVNAHQSSGSQSLKPFAKGLLAIFSCVIWD